MAFDGMDAEANRIAGGIWRQEVLQAADDAQWAEVLDGLSKRRGFNRGMTLGEARREIGGALGYGSEKYVLKELIENDPGFQEDMTLDEAVAELTVRGQVVREDSQDLPGAV